jgi:hypothetical protein
MLFLSFTILIIYVFLAVTTVLFSIIMLGISAHLTDFTIKATGQSIAAEGLAVAIAVLTLVFVPAMSAFPLLLW